VGVRQWAPLAAGRGMDEARRGSVGWKRGVWYESRERRGATTRRGRGGATEGAAAITRGRVMARAHDGGKPVACDGAVVQLATTTPPPPIFIATPPSPLSPLLSHVSPLMSPLLFTTLRKRFFQPRRRFQKLEQAKSESLAAAAVCWRLRSHYKGNRCSNAGNTHNAQPTITSHTTSNQPQRGLPQTAAPARCAGNCNPPDTVPPTVKEGREIFQGCVRGGRERGRRGCVIGATRSPWHAAQAQYMVRHIPATPADFPLCSFLTPRTASVI